VSVYELIDMMTDHDFELARKEFLISVIDKNKGVGSV
jgi:hypothetical protein